MQHILTIAIICWRLIKDRFLFNVTNPYEQKVQDYLIKNADLNNRNKLYGIMAVVDYWRRGKYSTGGRICMYMGGEGNLLEALDSNVVIIDPVDYENKDLIIRKIFTSLTPKAPPNAGNIHLHPNLCNLLICDDLTVRADLAQAHGKQNSVPQKADLRYFLYQVNGNEAKWVPAIKADIQKTFAVRA